MDQRLYALHLDYLRLYALDSKTAQTKRNVTLVPLPGVDATSLLNYRGSDFAWLQTRNLERRSSAPEHEGVWPLNYWRCDRRLGNVSRGILPQDCTDKDITTEICQQAKALRLFAYYRVRDPESAIRLLRLGREVRFSCEISADWYNPPEGVVRGPTATESTPPNFLGSHAVPLVTYDHQDGLFRFPNSWGAAWGKEGRGAFDRELFDSSVIEAWDPVCRSLTFPYARRTGIQCAEWKWSLTSDISVHGRELLDTDTDERLAWAFCTRQRDTLDVEEFFVWPTERGKGYGRQLARMVNRLAGELKLPIRLLTSFADTEPENAAELGAVAKLFGIHWHEASERWVHLIGQNNAVQIRSARRRPQRPAFVLEWLRPKDELPNTDNVKYPIYYATDRAFSNGQDAGSGFSGARGPVLRLGTSLVNIPKSHRFGTFGQWWNGVLRRFISKPDASPYEPLSQEMFLKHVAVMREPFDEPYNLLYVHGFNTSFDQALAQAGRFAVDLKIPGATVLYSWPSAGKLSHYTTDESTVDVSAGALADFLTQFLQHTTPTPLNIIAHSMGSRVVLRALERLHSSTSEPKIPQIRKLIFAAPDVDSLFFQDCIRRVHSVFDHATLYATRADWALQASEWLHSYPRAGLAPPVVTAEVVDTVVVEGFNLLNLGHGYFSDAAMVLHDMFNLLHFNAKPGRRPGVQETATTVGAKYWKIAAR